MCSYYSILVSAATILITFVESASKQPVSSQSYERGDVPVSYKQNFIDIYTTSKSFLYFNNDPRNTRPAARPQLTSYHHIQYAPLPLKNPERENHEEKLYTSTKTTASSEDINENDHTKPDHAQKSHLEPQFISTPATKYNRTQLNPPVHGYNVNPQRFKNKLNQYENKNELNLPVKTLQLKDLYQMNYVQPRLPHHKSEQGHSVHTTEAVVTKQYSQHNLAHPVLAHQNLQDVNKYNPNILTRKEHIEPYSFYVKASKVALNVARALNIARTQHKAKINMNSSFRKLPSLPQDFFFNSLILQLPRTQIYPYTQKRPLRHR